MTPFRSSKIEVVFGDFPPKIREPLLAVRETIFATAEETDGVGRLEETLKWGQPSYRASESKNGSPIRIGAFNSEADRFAVYFHCRTTIVSTIEKRFGNRFRYEGNRALVFDASDALRKADLKPCIALALTYHLQKKRKHVS